MIPGFEDAILGKKAGDEFTIEVTFPADYHAEALKGKAAKFASKLHKVEEQAARADRRVRQAFRHRERQR
jgi:trigger factor